MQDIWNISILKRTSCKVQLNLHLLISLLSLEFSFTSSMRWSNNDHCLKKLLIVMPYLPSACVMRSWYTWRQAIRQVDGAFLLTNTKAPMGEFGSRGCWQGDWVTLYTCSGGTALLQWIENLPWLVCLKMFALLPGGTCELPEHQCRFQRWYTSCCCGRTHN